MTTKREEMPDVFSFYYQTPRVYYTVCLGHNQIFMKTEKCYELWDKEPLRFLKRWRRKFIFWVTLKGPPNHSPNVQKGS